MLQEATGWPRSSVRARVAELRKAGLVGGNGEGLYVETDEPPIEGSMDINELKKYMQDIIEMTYRIDREYLASILEDEIQAKESHFEDAVIVVSDLHIGAYSESELKRKMDTLLDHTLRLFTRAEALARINQVHVFLLGDIITGETKYAGQPFEIEFPVLKQLALFIKYFTIYINSIRHFLGSDVPIIIDTVPGNHGVVSRYGSAETNWDNIAYEMLKLYYDVDKSIDVRISSDFYKFVTICGHRYLLLHGDGINMYQNIPLYGIVQASMRYLSSLGEHDVLILGHFHTTALMNWNGTDLLINGTAYVDDPYTLKKLKMKPDPRFWMFGVDEDRPITWMYRIYLE